MAGSAARRLNQAAEAVEAFLRGRSRAGNAGAGAGADQHDAGKGAREPATNHAAGAAVPERAGLGDQPQSADATATDGNGAPLRLPHTDWLLHRLKVTGPAAGVAAFRRTASGAGTIPWRLDLDSLEEDWFHRLMDPEHRALSLAGARVLAGQLRDAVEHRHSMAVARVGHSRACPFDLHALVPVPAAILQLGPDHPDALRWLWQHWGTTQPLRHVAPETLAIKGDGLPPPAGEDRLRLRFFSADWTPWRALQRIQADWPALRFDVRPDYGAG